MSKIEIRCRSCGKNFSDNTQSLNCSNCRKNKFIEIVSASFAMFLGL